MAKKAQKFHNPDWQGVLENITPSGTEPEVDLTASHDDPPVPDAPDLYADYRKQLGVNKVKPKEVKEHINVAVAPHIAEDFRSSARRLQVTLNDAMSIAFRNFIECVKDGAVIKLPVETPEEDPLAALRAKYGVNKIDPARPIKTHVNACVAPSLADEFRTTARNLKITINDAAGIAFRNFTEEVNSY